MQFKEWLQLQEAKKKKSLGPFDREQKILSKAKRTAGQDWAPQSRVYTQNKG